MGIVMSAASSVGTCLGVTLGNCVCQGVKQCLPVGYTAAKFYALLLFFASVVLAIILRTTQPSIDAKFFKVECTGQYADRCNGYQAVYRISFVDFFFFLAIAIGSKFHVGFHSNLWGLKYLIFIGSVFGMFFVENEVFNGYLHLARICSLLYLVAQVVTLINFSYQLHTILIGKRDEASTNNDESQAKFWEVVYLVVSVGLLLVALTGIGLLFAYSAACKVSQFWISVTLIAGVACTICAVLDQVQIGLLTPAFLFVYFDYMCWSAILSNPNTHCNPLADMPGAKEKTWNAVVSLVFLAMSLTYTAFSTYQTFTGTTLTEDEARGSIQAAQVTAAATATTSSTAVPSPSRRRTSFLRNAEMPLLTLREGDEQQQGGSTMDPKLKNILTGEEGGAAATTATTTEEGGSGGAAASASGGGMSAAEVVESQFIWIFHLLMALAGCYMAMAITNWGNGNGVPESSDTTVGVESMWLKIVSQWLCILLFLATMWAPYLRGEVEA